MAEKFIIIDRNQRHIIHGPVELLQATKNELDEHSEAFYDYFEVPESILHDELLDTAARLPKFETVEVTHEQLFIRKPDSSR